MDAIFARFTPNVAEWLGMSFQWTVGLILTLLTRVIMTPKVAATYKPPANRNHLYWHIGKTTTLHTLGYGLLAITGIYVVSQAGAFYYLFQNTDYNQRTGKVESTREICEVTFRTSSINDPYTGQQYRECSETRAFNENYGGSPWSYSWHYARTRFGICGAISCHDAFFRMPLWLVEYLFGPVLILVIAGIFFVLLFNYYILRREWTRPEHIVDVPPPTMTTTSTDASLRTEWEEEEEEEKPAAKTRKRPDRASDSATAPSPTTTNDTIKTKKTE